MKSTIASLAAVLSLSTAAVAQTYTQSKPFYLILHSLDTKYNGSALGACHEGAGIEALCANTPGVPLNSSDVNLIYQHNTTATQPVESKTLGKLGVLTFTLHAGNYNESEAMEFAYSYASNIVMPLIEPTENPTLVAFDKENRMNLQTELDDTVVPATTNKIRGLYRWYVCQTNFGGYVYETLSWVAGNGKPENPSCVKVDVVRQFV